MSTPAASTAPDDDNDDNDTFLVIWYRTINMCFKIGFLALLKLPRGITKKMQQPCVRLNKFCLIHAKLWPDIRQAHRQTDRQSGRQTYFVLQIRK